MNTAKLFFKHLLPENHQVMVEIMNDFAGKKQVILQANVSAQG